MALCAALCALKPDYDEEEESNVMAVKTNCLQNQQLNLDLAFADHVDVSADRLDVVVIGPKEKIVSNKDLLLSKRRTEKGVVLSLVPQKVGSYVVSYHHFFDVLLSPPSI